MSNTPQKKQVFSISQKYSEVFDILDGVENKSEFICQAIIEKFRGQEAIEDSVLEAKMRKIMMSLISEQNLFLVSGNINPNSIPAVVANPLPIEEVKGTVEEDDDDDDDYLKDIFKNM